MSSADAREALPPGPILARSRDIRDRRERITAGATSKLGLDRIGIAFRTTLAFLRVDGPSLAAASMNKHWRLEQALEHALELDWRRCAGSPPLGPPVAPLPLVASWPLPPSRKPPLSPDETRTGPERVGERQPDLRYPRQTRANHCGCDVSAHCEPKTHLDEKSE